MALAPAAGAVRRTKAGLELRVRLTPSGGADAVDGMGADSDGVRFVKARVRAAPEDGRANAALEALLARAIGVPRGGVTVARGAMSRMKWVAIDGIDEPALNGWLENLGDLA